MNFDTELNGMDEKIDCGCLDCHSDFTVKNDEELAGTVISCPFCDSENVEKKFSD